MANQLKLQVLLAAVDKITRPLKSIQAAAGTAARDVSETQKHIKELNKAAGQIDGYRKVSRSLGITSTELGKAQTEAQRLAKELAATANPTKRMIRNFEQARSQVQRLERRQAELTQTQRNHRAMLKDAGIDTRSLATHQRDLTRQLGEANRALEQQKNKLAEVSAQQKKLAAARNSYDQTKALQGNMAGAGAGLVAGGTAGMVPVVATVVGYSAFEDAMKGVAKQVEGARDENGRLTSTYYEMASAIKQIAEEIPQLNGAIDIAALVEGGARMGIKGREELLLYARTAAQAAKAFELPAEQLGEDMGKIANLYKIPMKNISELGDAINWLDDNAQSKGSDIIEVLQRMGGVADKLDFRNAAALGSTFLSLGATAETAGTAAIAMVRELSVATMQSKRFQHGMAALGLNSAEIEKAMSKDAMGTITQVLEAIKSLPAETQMRVTTQIFGKEYGKDAAKLANNMEELRRQINLTHDAAADGSMAREAGIDADSLSGQWTLLKAGMQNAFASMGETLRTPLMDIIRQIKGVVRAVRAWVEENPELTAAILKVVAAGSALAIVLGTLALTVAAVLGPLALAKLSMTVLGIKALPSLLPMLKAVGAGFIKLGIAIMTTPVGWILAAVAAIAGAGYLIYKNWDTVKQWLVGFWQSFKDLCAGGWELVKTLFSWSPLGIIASNWGQITSWLSQFWETIKTLASAGIQAIKDAFFNFHPLGLLIANWSAVTGWFASLPDQFREYGSNIISGLISGITEKIGAVKDTITGAGAAVAGWFKETLGINSPSKVFTQFGDDTMAGLANGLAKNHDPEQQVTATAKRLKAAGAGIALGMSIMPAAAEMPPVTDAQRQITEQLQPAALSPVTDAQRSITEQLQPAAPSPVTDAQRIITEQLQPAALSPVTDAQRQITEQLQPATVSPIADAQRQITEQLQPAALSPVTDAQRQITEQLQPAALSPVTDAQRSITEQLQPSALSPVTDAQRSITEQLQPAALSPVTDAQRQITEQLQPATVSPIADAQRQITEQLQPAALSPVTDAQRQITERLQPAALSPVADAQRQITERLQPAALSPVADAQRQITERLQPAALSPVADAQRQITEQLQPAILSPVTDAQRQITEQLQPAALSPVTDAQRQITEQLHPAALSPVTDAQRQITEQLQPATGLTDPDHDYRQIIEHLQPAGLPPIPDATRTIRERVERANLPDTSAAVARIQTQQQEQAQNRPAPAAAPATQDFSIGKIEINITAAPGMDEKDIAAQVRRELEAFQRQQAARNRARLTDLE